MLSWYEMAARARALCTAGRRRFKARHRDEDLPQCGNQLNRIGAEPGVGSFAAVAGSEGSHRRGVARSSTVSALRLRRQDDTELVLQGQLGFQPDQVVRVSSRGATQFIGNRQAAPGNDDDDDMSLAQRIVRDVDMTELGAFARTRVPGDSSTAASTTAEVGEQLRRRGR
jgi:hypothetical protein